MEQGYRNTLAKTATTNKFIIKDTKSAIPKQETKHFD